MDDAWEDHYREPTEDERSARRALALAIALINTDIPLTTTEVRRDLYPSISDEAFRKSFSRDRTRLAACGLVVQRLGKRDGEAVWGIDEERSFVRENHLTPEDSLTLDCLLFPLAADPTFPFARDLRLALIKVDRSFDGSSSVTMPREARKRNNNLSRIEDCMMRRHAAQISYERADKTKVERTILPYGLFPLYNRTYLVAAQLREGHSIPDEPHTYLVDRVQSFRELPRISYEVPADFDVRDYVLFPFQIGPTRYEAHMHVPPARRKDIQSRLMDRVSWAWDGDDLQLGVAVSDEEVAVAWCIAEGLVPLSPESLVNAWHTRLESTLGRFSS